jgi:hypothetical protein
MSRAGVVAGVGVKQQQCRPHRCAVAQPTEPGHARHGYLCRSEILHPSGRALVSARTETPQPPASLSLTWASTPPRRERFLPAGPRASADSAVAFKRRAEVRRGWRRMPTVVCAEASYRAARDQRTHSCRRRVVSPSCALRPAAARADRQRDRRLADRMSCSVGARALGASALGPRRRRRVCAAGRG